MCNKVKRGVGKTPERKKERKKEKQINEKGTRGQI